MRNHSNRWSPSRLVISGRFAGSTDLTNAVQDLSRAHNDTPVIAITFSADYVLPSLCRLHGFGAGETARNILLNLKVELGETLHLEGANAVVVSCNRIFEQLHGVVPTNASFGKSLDRPGDTKVVVFATAGDLRKCRHAEHVAACAFGSRNSAFHRENAIDLSTSKGVREARQLVDIEDEITIGNVASTLAELQISQLLNLTLSILDAQAVVTYDATGDCLRRHFCAGTMPDELMPAEKQFNEHDEVPPVPEEGGRHLADLGELANHCIFSQRRLVGILEGGKQWCIGFPFGAEHPGSRPAGAVCVVLRDTANEIFGSYELTLLRQVATHLARISAEERWASAIGLVSAHLGDISALGSQDYKAALVGCSSVLAGREDVRLSGAIIARVLADIADFSGAMSVTLRLIAGSSGDLFSRRLFRMHCVGVNCDQSPDSISVDDHASSVNAWVAVHGKAVYLRSLTAEGVGSGGDAVQSVDLARYPGLERPAIFRGPIGSELCVPVFAESKLVGTMNLESENAYAFDVTAEIVDEFAQLVGVVLLECRRQITVGTMAEARGFLGRRHELEARLINFGRELDAALADQEQARDSAAAQIQALRRFVYMRQALAVRGDDDSVRVDHVLRQAAESIEWTYKSIEPAAFAIDVADFVQFSKMRISKRCADALLFGVTQALLNVRKYGSDASEWLEWEYPVRYGVSLTTIGGIETLYVAVQSACSIEDVSDTPVTGVFRQPILNSATERTSLGTFLAGEILRRIGGSAYFRIEDAAEHEGLIKVVTAEFGVPALAPRR